MRLLVDENLARSAGILLKDAGHDVSRVGERLAGADDLAVLARARAEGRILVTSDTDFGQLIFHRHQAAPPAIVLLRLGSLRPRETARIVLSVLELSSLLGRFVVVDRNGIRVRALPV